MDIDNSPIGHLPPEILEVIFRLFIASFSPLAEIDAIFLLSRVCPRWHAICNSTPLLWTQPYFHRSKSPSLNSEIISTILSRSDGLPVSVIIDMISRPEHAPEAVLEYQPLLDVQDRLENLVLAVQRGDVVPHAPDMPKFPLLASLDITMTDDCEEPSELLALGEIFLSSCPSLRTFSLTVQNTLLPARIPNLPLHQLTSLTLVTPIQDMALYDMLIQCSLLEDLHVEEVEETGEVRTRPVHIMPALRSLDYTTAADCLGDILERLRFPLLDSLALSSAQPEHALLWDPVPIILELHEDSPFQLLHLAMSGLDTIPEELVVLLRCVTPTLETLVLDDMPHVLPVFAAPFGLTLPRLTTLEISGCSDEVDGAELVQLVDSLLAHRGESNGAFPTLHSVQLKLDGALFDEAVEEHLARVEADSNGFFRALGERVEEEEEEEIY
ncbi:hypothetical protein FB45DRAFT_1008585 [Roridomyces roridus]|uniref:F-box domain-containing protein n=1 Tax=Roridomyces roridus TaxID=1738132 RepID=A0AAD7BAY0_9AGAR|nr:hypothetical protein FB45DRAFT_1008585 [Roridomyces roridus]